LPELDPIAVRWSSPELAQSFWILDQLSRWSGNDTFPAYRETLEKEWKLDAEDLRVLEAYARARKKLSTETRAETHDVDLLPPKERASDRFAIAFLGAASLAAALDKAGLAGDDRKAVEHAFTRFEKRLTTLRNKATFLQTAQKRLVELAERSKMASFLALMARFYGVEKRIEPLEILVLWAPDANQNATTVGPFMVIPISERLARDDAELAGWVGVTVHEFGHYFASRISDDARLALSRRLIARLGFVNRHHPNIVDEATQTALGNIIFMRERLPSYFENASFYAYEAENDRPDAIDSLSRALDRSVRAHLPIPDDFSHTYLNAVVEQHEIVFPPEPRHHTRELNLFVETKALRNAFSGLFPAFSRSSFVGADGLASFAAATPSGSAVPRWLILTRDFARAHGSELQTTVKVDEIDTELERGPHGACLRAAPRKDGSFEFVAIGRDHDALRRLLIAARAKVGIPVWESYCVTPSPSAGPSASAGQ
jgi:hypothetical protein